MDYERIDTYLTEIGASDEILDTLDRITCLAQRAGLAPVPAPLHLWVLYDVQPLATRSNKRAGLICGGGLIYQFMMYSLQFSHSEIAK